MSLGVEDVFGVPDVFHFGIFGVVDFGVTSKVALWFPSDFVHGITDVVAFVFTDNVSLGSNIFVPSKVYFDILMDPCLL